VLDVVERPPTLTGWSRQSTDDARPPAPARTPDHPARVRALVAATLITLAVALVWQLVTMSHGGHSALSDLPRVLLHRGIGPDHPPYLDRMLEYPVGSGVLLYLASVVSPTPTGVLVVTALAAAAAAVSVTVLLARRNGARTWRWALASPLLLFAFQNWDTFAIAALVAGLVAFERRRPATAGVLLGVGTVIKLFPGIVVPVLLASALVRRDVRSAQRLLVGFLATLAVVNLPVMLLAGHGWWWPMQFQGARAATWGTVWMYGYRVLGLPTHGPQAAHLANAVSTVALAIGMLALVAYTARRRVDPIAASAAAVGLLLLTNKVYSPTYDLWLVVFFVMLAIPRRVWIAFCVLDLAIYVVVFGYFHHLIPRAGVATFLPIFVLARAAVLVTVVVLALRRRDAPTPAVRMAHVPLRDRVGVVDRYRPLVVRLRRCASVSVVTTVLSLVSLVVMTTFGVAAVPANVMTTTLATIPSYQLNRRWTWNRTGSSNLWREVVPFWAMSFAGLAASTVTVGIADRWAVGAHITGVLHTGTILAGHLGGFALLWLVQFAILDRVVFSSRIPAPDAAPPA
jgi:putative flippase GtrA